MIYGSCANVETSTATCDGSTLGERVYIIPTGAGNPELKPLGHTHLGVTGGRGYSIPISGVEASWSGATCCGGDYLQTDTVDIYECGYESTPALSASPTTNVSTPACTWTPMVVETGRSCANGEEHTDWMHLGDANGLADCVSRVAMPPRTTPGLRTPGKGARVRAPSACVSALRRQAPAACAVFTTATGVNMAPPAS